MDRFKLFFGGRIYVTYLRNCLCLWGDSSSGQSPGFCIRGGTVSEMGEGWSSVSLGGTREN